MLSRVLQVFIMAMALAASSGWSQEPPLPALWDGKIAYYYDAQGRIIAIYDGKVAGRDLAGFLMLSLQDKKPVYGGDQQFFSQFLQFSPEVQKALGCEKIDGILYYEGLNNPLLSVVRRDIPIRRMSESSEIESKILFYAIRENGYLDIKDMPSHLDKNQVTEKIHKIINGSGYLPQDNVLVLLRDHEILRHFKILDPGMGLSQGGAATVVPFGQNLFFGVAGALLGGIFLFLMLMLRGPRPPESPSAPLRTQKQTFTPSVTPVPQSAVFPQAVAPFEVERLRSLFDQALRSWSDELSRRWGAHFATFAQELRQQSQSREQSLASRVASQEQAVRDIAFKTAALHEGVQTLLARIPEPPPQTGLSAEDRQRWERALEFGRKFREWLDAVRKQQDLPGEAEARAFFSRFWKTCLAEKVGEFVGDARLMVQSAHLPESPPDLQAGLRGLLFGCVSPALILVFRLNFLVRRRGGSLAPEALSAFTTLKNELDACLELLAAPPFAIRPLNITPLRPCDDRFMHPLEGNIREYLPDFQEQPGRQKVILDVRDWAFLQDGTLLDGRRAKVVHG